MSDLWQQSVACGLMNGGLIDPYTRHPLKCGCGCKGAPATDAQLSARRHRWPRLDRAERLFFRDTMRSVSQMESEILQRLGLPPINAVRLAILTGQAGEGGRWTRYGREQEKVIDDAISGHLKRFLGEPWDMIKEAKPQSPLYKMYQLQAMSISADYVESLIEAAPGHPEIVLMIAPDPEYLLFRAMQEAAGKRIRTTLALENLPQLKRELERMAQNGDWSLDVARKIHNAVGEGQAWYWRRITRTEFTLANNLAYDWMAEKNGVLYDEWAAGPDACIICAGFNGQIWEHGQGPYPATDTHPHCMCVLLPKYIPGGELQDRWTRESPYDNPYSDEEIDAIIQRLAGRRSDLGRQSGE